MPATPYAREVDSTLADITALSGPLTVSLLSKYIIAWYADKSFAKLKKANIPIMTENLLNKAKIVIKVMKMISNEFTLIHEQRLLQRIRNVIVHINFNCPMFKKQAPVVTWNTVKLIAKNLWNDTSIPRGSNVNTVRKRKAAATAMLLASKSGGRWIDVHRLRWEDLNFSKIDNILFIQAKLRLSKNNLINDFPQSLTWASAPGVHQSDCPKLILKRWWNWCGKPKSGLIFSTIDKKQINGNHTIYQIRRQAVKLGIKQNEIPTKHSFRITMCLTLKSMGLEPDTINRFMNWRSETMQSYYLNIRNMRKKEAPAHRIANLSQNELADIQSNLF